ncbi:MAG: hypothetical protein WD995_08130, partial [Gemmatimonadota bacterium]
MILPHDPNAPPTPRPDSRDGSGPEHPPSQEPGPAVAWTPFDPGEPPELPGPPGGPGPVVAVAASAELVRAGWAVSVAAELARAWAAQRSGLVVVDTDLARPRLHHTLGVDNATGLAEVLGGDAPVSTATRVVEPDRLFCVPAGNAPGEPEEAFDGARWTRFCRAFSDAGVTVVSYVPATAPWADQVFASATHLVELREHDGEPTIAAEHRQQVIAVLGPMPIVRAPANPTGKESAGSAPLLGFHAAGD